MLKFKFTFIRVLSECLLMLAMYFSYEYGIDLGIRLFGFDYWFINFVYGAIVAAVCYWILSKVKTTFFFFCKSGYIYAISNPSPTTSVSKALIAITCDWKETAAIPLINVAIRKLFDTVTDKLLNGEEGTEQIEELKNFKLMDKLKDTKIWMIAKKLTIQTFDYADECVLGYCYHNDDPMLKEIITGFLIFIKKSPKLIRKIISAITISIVVKVLFVIFAIWGYLHYGYFALDTVIPFYIVLYTGVLVIQDALIEPLTCDSIVKEFIADLDVDQSELDALKEKLKSVIDFSNLEKLTRRFDNDEATDGSDSDTQEGTAEE